MVAPDRDTPGTRAMHCIRPITMVSVSVSCDSFRFFVPTRSAIHITTLHSTSATTTTQRLRRPPVMRCRASSPMMPMGMVPMMTNQASR